MLYRFLVLVIAPVLLSACGTNTGQTQQSDSRTPGQYDEAACTGLARAMEGRWPDESTRTVDVRWHEEGSTYTSSMPPMSVALPEHCELTATMRERTGQGGQRYAIRFHVRLPADWNGRFLFQGGAGSNGQLGSAIGMPRVGGRPTMLHDGFAIVSQDSGHDNAVNTVPQQNGRLAFGLDPVARADYGGDSLWPVAHAALAVINVHYGRHPDWSYFQGCSKGGQEGMVFAQRHPELFDGIIANAPGFSLPRAAIAEIWDLQSFAAVGPESSDESISLQQLRDSFSDGDLELARNAVLAACDADDGVRDGMTAAFESCDSDRVAAAMQRVACPDPTAKTTDCLSRAQIRALTRVYAGPKSNDGAVDLYTDWPWDGGLGTPGWRNWKIGSADGRVPSLNFVLGALGTGSMFSTPPEVVADDPEAIGTYAANFDFDKDARKIYTIGGGFGRSAWDVISARSPDLRSFRAQGGKMLVAHGVSDPVFSINDTLAWYRQVDRLSGGTAHDFVRVFPLPGMAHCAGGRSVAEFDVFGALMAWVEEGKEPVGLVARGGEGSPWPERTRPVCAYPKYARYIGNGSIEEAESFECAADQ